MSDYIRLSSALLHALENQNREAVFSIVGQFLDLGHLHALREVSLQVEAEMPEEIVDMLSAAIDLEAQGMEIDGMQAALFCIPFLVDPARVEDLPTDEVRAALCKLAAPGDRMVVADGWVHLNDLLDRDPAGYRELTRAMASAALSGQETMAFDPSVFRHSPARRGDDIGGAGFTMAVASGQIWTQVAARFILGVIARDGSAPPSECVIGEICDGDGNGEMAEIIEAVLEPLIGHYRGILVPNQPYGTAIDAANAIECVAFEARLQSVAAQLGKKPIAHFCTDECHMHIVLTQDGKTVIDTIRLEVSSMDGVLLADIIEEECAGMVEHKTLADMPQLTKPTVLH